MDDYEEEERTPPLRTGDDECDAASAGGEEEDGVGAVGEEVEVEVEQEDESRKSKKRPPPPAAAAGGVAGKRPKKRNSNVWSKSTSRKSSKKGGAPKAAAGGGGVCAADGANGGNNGGGRADPAAGESRVLLNPVLPKVDDGPELPVMLSKIHKAEKVELSADRMTAGSCKGYRMVKATRGVLEGAWYFEMRVEHLGDTGHTRLGWCTQKGDVQAPVGYDQHGYAYRDVDGSKVHSAWREAYAEAYAEGDTIGFYINLPNGAALAPKLPELVTFKGGTYATEMREEPLKPLPGSQVAFFKNSVFQGIAFRDIYAGTYFPAASMYTLPNQDNCTVRFNFGPEFACPPSDWGELAEPQAMSNAPFLLDGHEAARAARAAAAAAAAATEALPHVETKSSMEEEVLQEGAEEGKPPKSSSSDSTKGSSGPVEVAIESLDTVVPAQTTIDPQL